MVLSETFIEILKTTTNVKAMTTGGSKDRAWFIARGFSFTSSTVDKVIHAVHEFVRCNRSSVTDNILVTTLNAILSYIGKTPINLPRYVIASLYFHCAVIAFYEKHAKLIY